MTSSDIRIILERRKGQLALLNKQLTEAETTLAEEKSSLKRHEQAREIIREAGLRTQQQIQINISDIASLALEAVFPDPYELKVEFVQRRNKTECDIYFIRDEQPMDPMTASGGGAVDIAAFALRIASWSMATPRPQNIIIMDEPLRFLSANLQERASAMIKELSERLGIQFIIVTHEPALTMHADRLFEVSIKKGVSQIKYES